MTGLGKVVGGGGNPEFNYDDYVEFGACPGTLFKIVGGHEPFWELEHVAGPKIPTNYHKTLFEADPPQMPPVIESILQHVNPLTVLAIMATGGAPE